MPYKDLWTQNLLEMVRDNLRRVLFIYALYHIVAKVYNGKVSMLLLSLGLFYWIGSPTFLYQG